MTNACAGDLFIAFIIVYCIKLHMSIICIDNYACFIINYVINSSSNVFTSNHVANWNKLANTPASGPLLHVLSLKVIGQIDSNCELSVLHPYLYKVAAAMSLIKLNKLRQSSQ